MQDGPFLRCVARGIEVELWLKARADSELITGKVPVAPRRRGALVTMVRQ